MFDKARQMFFAACRSKGTRDTYKHNSLVGKVGGTLDLLEFAGIHIVGVRD